MKNKTRLMAVILSVIMALFVLVSVVYIAENRNHECTGKDCDICHNIESCERVLSQLGLSVFYLASIIPVMMILSILPCVLDRFLMHKTLITLKVQLTC